jgi:hypothetical protein
MKTKQQAPTIYSIDANGQRIAHVALANSPLRAALYADKYEQLMTRGYSPFWRLTKNGQGGEYVTLCAYSPSGHLREVPVARLIVGTKRGERACAKDGDMLNLLDENLYRCSRTSWINAADWFPNMDALRAAGIEYTRVSRGLRKQKKQMQ